MTAYYNEIDAYSAQWLRNLIAAGHLPDGDVDERSIIDVRPDDLSIYDQCHFFAGLGGWAHALRLAGWPDDRKVWTGSCPCQPFSSAGQQQGTDDDRHLWPVWFGLIRECRPDAIFGEQVASKLADEWLISVSSDLEGEGYRIGAVDLPACSVGAPHLRQRRWFVADADKVGRLGRRPDDDGISKMEIGPRTSVVPYGVRYSQIDNVALGNTDNQRLQGSRARRESARRSIADGQCRPSGGGHWADANYLPCIDDKSRPVEPGTYPLAHGLPGRVGRLRAYGNAIVPQAAAAIITAYMEIDND
tara:strand:+ start:552 stop:1460 length:909 start_codon:yes stop_codon:yes gene_type:complete